MDQHKKKKNPIHNPFNQIYTSKKAIQILFSLSVFAFIYSQSSTLLPFLLSASSSIKFFSYSTDRNYVFLLCNGILIVVIKTSGLFATIPHCSTDFKDNRVRKINIQSSHQSTDFKDFKFKRFVQLHQCPSSVSTELSEKMAEINEAELEVDESKSGVLVMDQGGETVTFTTQYEEEEKVDELLEIVQEQEEELVNVEEEEGGIGLLTIEELNKKCDEFIRKMKSGIKFESQQLILV